MRKFLTSAAIGAALLVSAGTILVSEPGLALGAAGANENSAEAALLLPAANSSANAGVLVLADDLVAEDIGDADAAKDDSAEDVAKAEAATKQAVATKPSSVAEPAAPIADMPKRTKAASLASQVREFGAPAQLDAEMQCLAGAIYFESKGESLTGQLAVAHVVLNRAASGRFPSTLCGVVYQRSQFSFIRGGRMPAIATGSQDWREAVAIAQIAKSGLWESPVGKALFFHATHVSPGWKLKRVATIENHVFYR
jgi:N-acetylmuramoyl-L-alanine amidase